MPRIGEMIWPTQRSAPECPEWMDHLDDREPVNRCTVCGEDTSACECSAP